MKKYVIGILFLCLCIFGGWLLSGCSGTAAAAAPSSSEAAAQEADGKVLYGLVSRVNGNEIEVEYLEVTGAVRVFGGPQGAAPGGMTRGSGASGGAGQGQGQRPSDASGEARTGSRPDSAAGSSSAQPAGPAPDAAGQTDGAGALPQMPQNTEEEETITVTNITGSSSPYTRTGETATLLVPVGTPVLTGSGANQKTRTFNSLQSNYIIAITMKEAADGTEYVGSIQVLQTA